MKKIILSIFLLVSTTVLTAQGITWMGNEYTTIGGTQYLGDDILFEIQSNPINGGQGAQVYIDWNNDGYGSSENIDWFNLAWQKNENNNSWWNNYVRMQVVGTHNRKYLGWQTSQPDYVTGDFGTFTVTALTAPSSLLATTISSTQIDLSWTKWNSKNVIVVRYPDGSAITDPTNGTSYSVGNSIGLGTVVYNGSESTCSDIGLTPSTTYDYLFYSVNNDYYSVGSEFSNKTTGKAITSAASTAWNISSTWSSNSVPTTIDDVTITSAYPVTVTDLFSECANLTIDASSNLYINAGQRLTVIGSITNNNTTDGITLKSPTYDGAAGSLKFGGSYVGSGKVISERYIAAYTTPSNGWHLFAAPFDNFDIAGTDYAPTATDDDFFYWDQSQSSAGLWMNWGTSSFNLAAGKGYLVAYKASETKSMSGIPYNLDVTFTNLSMANPDPTYNNTWHLLGNPYTCALDWNNGNGWNLTGINGTAKVMDVTDGSYNDVAAGGDIPAQQGFFVSVENATNSITIPLEARVHSTQAWYKASSNNIKLIARDLDQQLAQKSNILINENGKDEYDYRYDSRFLGFYAPSFYSIKGGQILSTNNLKDIDEYSEIPFGFVTNGSTNFQIELAESNIDLPVYITDKKTNTTHKLSDNPTYAFTSQEGDDPNRFTIHFGVVGIEDQLSTKAIQAYVSGNQLTILGNSGDTQVDIINLHGQVVQSNMIYLDGKYNQKLNLKAGVYIVRTNNISNKVIIN